RFEFCRTDIRQRLMQPLAIIEYLNELENLGAGFVPRAVPSVMDQFILQGAKEALDRRIVIAIAFATHTGPKVVLSEHRPIHRTRILRALIRMVDQAWLRLSLGHRH